MEEAKSEGMPPKGAHQNTARVVAVLEALSDAGDHGLRLTDLVDATGLGVSVIHRLLNGLVAHRLVDFDERSNRYLLGLWLISLTAAATERYGLARFADFALDRLAGETADTIYLSVLSGHDSVCVDRREGAFPIRTLTLNVGDYRPLGVGAGSMALLAFQAAGVRDDIVAQDQERRDSFGLSNDWLTASMEQTIQDGFALNDGRLIQGMSGVGVPIRKKDGVAIGAVSVAAISDRLSGDRLQWVVGLVRDAVRQIEELGSDVINSPIAKRQAAGRHSRAAT